jgi:transposase
VVDVVPHGRWKTSTFIGALRGDGLIAPGLFDGPINGDAFIAYVEQVLVAYVEQVLVPTLRKGDVVIMNDLGSHKVKWVRKAIEAAGASLMFIPPDSPDLNSIEQAFTKLKACCAPRNYEPSRPSGMPSTASWTASHQRSVQTSSAENALAPRAALPYRRRRHRPKAQARARSSTHYP